MSHVRLKIWPGAEAIHWDDFCSTHPPYSIALDGYVIGASRFDGQGPWMNLDHHADVDRLATRATCAQVWLSLRQGLFHVFRDEQGRRAEVHVNDCDEDVCLSWYLLQNPQLAEGPTHARLYELIQAVDELDTTAGASLQPPTDSFACALAWIFAPYRNARLRGVLDGADELLQRSVIDAVVQRIALHLAGKGGSIALDKRYETLGGGRGWAMVREIGAQSRTAMVADGIRAFVSVRRLANSGWAYAVGRASPFVDFDVPRILHALNLADESWRGRWGGGNLIGGSPRVHGSGLEPEQVKNIVDHVLAFDRGATVDGPRLGNLEKPDLSVGEIS